MLCSSFLLLLQSLISAMYKMVQVVMLFSGGWYIPLHVFQKCTEMLLVHLGPVMQIKLQTFRITNHLPSQHGHVTFLPH